ncbi:cxyorf1 [Anaeramoeba flamelloides]|uniref:Cxyorf1 n=1 Tax=Anaeramoeba flamelloides TaxID=1746091 RepID=A0ABQ8XX68_9EUKA|nr:cxyorf1 [Anaeramoeba flamelloides]
MNITFDDQVFEVPVIPHNLPQTQSFLQTCESLVYLQNVVDKVFERVNERIKEQSESLEEINHRIKVSSEKVNKILGSSRSTTIMSSAKYPIPKNRESYSPMYSKQEKTKSSEDKTVILQDEPGSLPLKSLLRKKKNFEVMEEIRREEEEQIDGLGRLPEKIHSVSSLLLFNTQENPYRDYQMLDNLMGSNKEREDEIEDSTFNLLDAPLTLQEDIITHGEKIDVFFRPEFTEVPQWSEELTLDLPFVASDISFSQDNFVPIAPSFPIQNMPSLEDEDQESELKEIDQDIEVSNVDPNETLNVPPPELPPPNLSTPSLPPPNLPPPNLTNSSVPPPPKVPEGGLNFVSTPSTEATETANDSNIANKLGLEIDSGRGNLLDSIRKGTKLRSVKDRKLKSLPKVSTKKESSGGFDMFAELQKNLSRRRKAIGGRLSELSSEKKTKTKKETKSNEGDENEKEKETEKEKENDEDEWKD